MRQSTSAQQQAEFDYLTEVARRVGLDDSIVDEALRNIGEGDLVRLGLSGWLASGKDEVAKTTVPAGRHCSFAAALKGEVNEIIQVCAEAGNASKAIDRVEEEQGVLIRHAAFVVGLLWAPTRDSYNLPNAFDRTTEMRVVNQYWGTEVRRTADPNYWVDRGIASAIKALAAGESPFFTDARFPNEVDGLIAAGFTVVRLEISRRTQLERLTGRGDPPPDPSVLNHESETALDDYTSFTATVNNEGSLLDTVDNIRRVLNGEPVEAEMAAT